MQPEEQAQWDYKPGNTPEPDGPAPSPDDQPPQSDPESEPEPDNPEPPSPAHADAPPFSWTAVEFIEHKRGAGWYLMLVGATIVLAGAMYLVRDIFAAVVMVVVGLILAVMAGRKPHQMQYELSSGGLRVGEKLYPYNDYRSFSIIVEENDMKSVIMLPLKRIALPVSAYFDPKDEQKILDAISDYLPFEEHQVSVIDRLGHRLRI